MRIVRRILLAIAALVVLALVGFVIWAELPMRAELGPLAEARAASTFSYSESGGNVVLTPDEPTGEGLVFIAGARVEPQAYADKLSGLAEDGVTVVIVAPVLNFAIFEFRSLDDFTGLAPDVDEWFVGGHSLGGVRACQYAADGEVAGLILFGSYCSADIADTGMPVLTLEASNDGLSTPAKIAAASDLLPADAELVTLPGAVHAQFGDYGVQPGDGEPTATDAEVRAEITAAVLEFVS